MTNRERHLEKLRTILNRYSLGCREKIERALASDFPHTHGQAKLAAEEVAHYGNLILKGGGSK